MRPRWSRSSSGPPEELRLTLAEHIDELRTRLVRVVWVLVLGMIVGWVLEPPVYEVLSSVAVAHVPEGVVYEEVFNNFTAPFFLKVKMAFFIGLVLVLPFIVVQVWGFVAPGLRKNEQRIVRIVSPISVLLFFGGGVMGWFMLPFMFQYFMSFALDFQSVSILQEAGTLVFLVIKLLFAFGLGFQLPLVVFFLGKIGVLEPENLGSYWRQAVVVIFVVSAIITPPDAVSMFLMAGPLCALFFLSILAVKLTSPRKSLRPAELNELD